MRALVFFLVVVLVAFADREARAQNAKVEAAAKALQKKAMDDDYLQSEFAKAADKLEKAITQCGEGRCSPALRARLHRDLGVVQLGGGVARDKAIEHFVEALKTEPTLTLDPDVRTKDLDAAFAEAKKRGGASAASAPPASDFTHTPPAEQRVRTPIPIYAEYTGDESVVRVVVRYRGFGMADWKAFELKKTGESGWAGHLPCADVEQGGPMHYYLSGFNANNDQVASGGDRTATYKVAIKGDAVADPPHLPNAAPPAQCIDTSDCPPNFPGCKSTSKHGATVRKDLGETCDESSECKSRRCSGSKCVEKESTEKPARLWLGLSGALDWAFVPSVDNVCKLHPQDATDPDTSRLPVNDANYYCVRSDGSDYPSREQLDENGAILPTTARQGSDKVNGGGALGNVRLMLALDYALTPNVLIGARLGLVLNSYPGEQAAEDEQRFTAPVHLEARGTYVFGKDALHKAGFAPYLFAGAGIGQFETRVSVAVIESRSGQAPVRRDVDAWHIAGPGFVSFGGGGRYAVTPRFALMFGLRANFAFGNAFVPGVGPELGGQIGF